MSIPKQVFYPKLIKREQSIVDKVKSTLEAVMLIRKKAESFLKKTPVFYIFFIIAKHELNKGI